MTAHVGDTPSSSGAADKSALRRTLRQARRALPQSQRSRLAQRCAKHAARALRLRRVRHVAVYLACGSELSTQPLIGQLLDAGVQLYVPRLVGGGMRMIELRGRLRRNRHGIAEPCGARQRRPRALDAILLPLTGFDAQGHRLGTGGGYYDRFLARSRGRWPWKLGYAYALQECASLPADPWDVRLDAVCTERGLRRFPILASPP